ncbi:cholinesterase 1 [Branchiostoma lanceolatum]|uniref:cholinesterase 1 n=1 Tax=Branchiostoma lanceolatum TaxID=7740 RepID=UPI0034552D5A
MASRLLLQILPLLVLVRTSVDAATSVVTTSAGQVSGLELDVLGRKVNAFLGIPFAKPPIGDLRFKAPEPADSWTDVYEATQFPNSCMLAPDEAFPGFHGAEMWNPNTPISEDCLYLNVWQPSPAPTGATVLVWIYGGGFFSGTSSLDVYDGRYLARMEDVVVVSMNYRLGALGFLYTGSEAAPGNAGLLDQHLALQWVQQNIQAFGGDPGKVTIFGESAGAASVNFHMLSPMSRDLFQRAMMHSASALAPWAVTPSEQARQRSKALAIDIGCSADEEDMDVLVACLREVSAQTILDHEWNVVDLSDAHFLADIPFPPIKDGRFLTEDPAEMYAEGNFKDIDILVGFVKDEGNFWLVYGVPGFDKDTDSIIDRETFVGDIAFCHPRLNDITVEATAFEYTDWLHVDQDTMYRDALDSVFGDPFFVCPTMAVGKAHVNHGRTAYVYEFAQVASNLAWPHWMGAMHGYEIEFIFGLPIDPKWNYTAEEGELARRMMRYWTNFARTGNPNKRTADDPTDDIWRPYTEEGREYMILDTEGTRMLSGPRSKQCAFWDRYMPSLQKETDDLINDAGPCSSGGRSWTSAGVSKFTSFVTAAMLLAGHRLRLFGH